MSFIDSVLDLAKKVLPVVEAATGPYVTAALEAAEAVRKLVENVKETASETDQTKLQATLEELEARVSAHAQSTIDRLGGE